MHFRFKQMVVDRCCRFLAMHMPHTGSFHIGVQLFRGPNQIWVRFVIELQKYKMSGSLHQDLKPQN